MHIHVSALDAIKTFLYVVVLGFFWRTLSTALHSTSIGKAMAFIY